MRGGCAACGNLPQSATKNRGRHFGQPVAGALSDTLVMRTILIVTLVALLTAGCAGNRKEDGAVQGVGSAEADKLNASRARFDDSKDQPFTADTHFAAAQLAESQGQPDRAIEQYRLAIKLEPKHIGALYRLAMIETRNKRYPQAIAIWKEYVKASKNSATAMSNLAFCYDLAGQTAEAESTFQAGISHEPSNQPCRVNYGLMLARLGRADEALAQLLAVLEPGEAHYNLASVYEQQGSKDQARAEYRKALEMNPRLWEARARLSKID